jgi:hypothetical protein
VRSSLRSGVVVAVSVLACHDSNGPPAPVARVVIHPDSIVVHVDSTTTITADVLDAQDRALRDRPVAWLAFDTTVARVDVSGNLQGLRVGPTEIVAASESVVTRAPVAVVVRLHGIALGERIACALSPEGQPYCWGLAVESPTRVEGSPNISSIVTGANYACGLTQTGQAYCWGVVLPGNGSDTTSDVPVAVNGVPFASLAPGWGHVCGLTFGGSVQCWGTSSSGALGSSAESAAVPIAVNLPENASALASGDRFTCAVTVSGAVYCWGDNTYGQIGDTVLWVHECNQPPCRSTPARVDSLPALVSISASGTHVCGLTSDSTTYCWGDNHVGQLGALGGAGCYYRTYHLSTWDCSYVPRAVSGVPRFALVAAGYYHTCGSKPDRSVLCWGDNHAGAFGNGEMSNGPLAVPAGGGVTFRAISPANGATCGIPVTEDVVYCWGGNWWNVLGNGTTGLYDLTPHRVLYQP